jgi:excinuclease ABC subunit C
MVNKNDIQKAPSQTGIYIFYENKVPIYIGKAINIKARLLSHLKNAETDRKEGLIISKANKVAWQVVDSEFKALLLEASMIQKSQPKYNLVLKDDKSYLYIKITKDEFPKVLIVRKENDGKSTYFGPFNSYDTVSKIVRGIRTIIPFCTQNRLTNRRCFYSKIGLCNPCPNYVSKLEGDEKDALKKVYLKNIAKVKRILTGNISIVITDLEKQIKKLSKDQKYEEAIKFRNKLQSFQKLLILHRENWGNINTQFMENSKVEFDLLVKKYFQDEGKGKGDVRIECYDISNISGEHGTASMTVFENFAPALGEYRKFKIKTTRRTSDPYLMREVLTRRFKNKWKLPNLILLDGGRPQLLAFQSLIKDDEFTPIYCHDRMFPLVGIAKNPDRLISGWDLKPINSKEIPNLFNTFKQLRDESHRFAKKYHVELRSKAKKMI